MRIARPVEILPGEAVVDAEGPEPRGVTVLGRVAEGLAMVPAPEHLIGGVGHEPRGVEVVGMEVEVSPSQMKRPR